MSQLLENTRALPSAPPHPIPPDSGTEGDPAEKGLILHFREACIGEIG